MKTILHISKYYYPDLGGIETVAKYLAEGLTEYNNIVICFSTDKKYHEDNVNGVKVYRIPVTFSFMSQDVAFKYFYFLKKIIKLHKPDFAHLHCPNPFVYPLVVKAISKDTKLVLHWHSDILAKGAMYNIIKPFENQVLRRADVIIATSPNYIDYSKPLLKHKDKVKVAQNGIITADFELKPGDEERIKQIKEMYGGKKIVYFVGRHIPYKGIDFLIKADKYIKNDCVILIVGKGPHDKVLKKIPCSDRVKFLGRLSDEDLRCYSHAADIFAFSSVTKAEAFGVALSEAMYCKSVPVVFNIKGSGVNWVSVAGKTGEEVPLKDIKAYANAIDKILADDNLQHTYAEAARERIIKHFTAEIAVSVMNDIYKNL